MSETAKVNERKPVRLFRTLHPADVVLTLPLYEPLALNVNDRDKFYEFLGNKYTLDCHCPGCHKDATFKSTATHNWGSAKPFEEVVTIGGTYTLPFECTRSRHPLICHFIVTAADKPTTISGEVDNEKKAVLEKAKLAAKSSLATTLTASHRPNAKPILVVSKVSTYFLVKVGQYPSRATIDSAKLKEFRKTLDESQHEDLSRAVGLHSHGIGIGAFVYLRRLFEWLIDEAYKIESAKKKWKKPRRKQFVGLRMDEQIQKLKDSVPDFLHKNRAVYGILSKGIHELSEEECLEMFDTILGGIELMLEERRAKQLKEKREKEITASIQTYNQRIQSRDAVAGAKKASPE